MKVIWKYHLSIASPTRIELPQGAQILTAQAQNGEGCIWALVDSDAPKAPRYFEIHGTGNPIPLEAKGRERCYVGTFQQPPFVWHVFENVNTERQGHAVLDADANAN